MEREWLDATPPAGHPLIHGIFQRLRSLPVGDDAPACPCRDFDVVDRGGACPRCGHTVHGAICGYDGLIPCGCSVVALPLTGDDITDAIAVATPLINPRLSEVDWTAVAAALASVTLSEPTLSEVTGPTLDVDDKTQRIARLLALDPEAFDWITAEAARLATVPIREALEQKPPEWLVEYNGEHGWMEAMDDIRAVLRAVQHER